MIQANELRLGNIIGMNHRDHPGQTVEKVVDCTVLNLIAGYVPTPEDMKAIDFVPIKLTEEILLKCGFVESTIRTDFKLKLSICDINLYCRFNTEWYFELEGIYFGATPKHLHQLQNLYFALTGKELEVKL